MKEDSQPTCDLSILIVSWNVWELLSACLHSIETISRPDVDFAPDLRLFGPADQHNTLEVIVVDNASNDPTCAQLSQQFPWVRLIRSESNLGFTKGNNLGYQASRGCFVLFLNPDTEIIAPVTPDDANSALPRTTNHAPQDSLWLLYSALRADETIGMAGPQLRYADGSWQNSRRRFPTPLTGFFESTWLGQAWRNNPWSQNMHMADVAADSAQDVDWITGAAMLARRAALEAVAEKQDKATKRKENIEKANRFAIHHSLPFDEGFFMYSEELDLCKRVKDAGWRIVYVPEARLIHYEGKSSEQVGAARHIRFNTSKVRYWHKWFGAGWSELLRNYLLFEYRWQWLNEWAKATLGSKREMRHARMAAYQEVLRSGLRG